MLRERRGVGAPRRGDVAVRRDDLAAVGADAARDPSAELMTQGGW